MWHPRLLALLRFSQCYVLKVFKNSTFFRSSHRRCSIKKDVLENFAKFKGKHLCQSPFFNKVAGRPATLFKKGHWHRCLPVNFAKFLRTFFLQNTSGGLLMFLSISLIYFSSFDIILFSKIKRYFKSQTVLPYMIWIFHILYSKLFNCSKQHACRILSAYQQVYVLYLGVKFSRKKLVSSILFFLTCCLQKTLRRE